jgi:hypothetical protein
VPVIASHGNILAARRSVESPSPTGRWTGGSPARRGEG